jgi:hypothetical protein
VKKLIFLVFILLLSFCSSDSGETTNENIESQLLEEIPSPESKITISETQKNENSASEAKEIEEETSEVEESEEYYQILDEENLPNDLEYIPGTFLAEHCFFEGSIEGVYYEEESLSDLGIEEELNQTYFTKTQQYQDGNILCSPNGHVYFSIGGDILQTSDIFKPESQRRDLYGLSFYDRIFSFYDVAPDAQNGLWGQWIQAPDSHPFGPGGGSIEGGLYVNHKVGRTKFPKYMASGATQFYSPDSSYYGWGFFERRTDCECYGGIQITNRVLNTPNLISFDEQQNTFDDDGGIYFGHGWFALPLIGGDYRELVEEPSEDIGKLTWTFFMNSAQFSGPTWAYVPEFWYRRMDTWNIYESYADYSDQTKEIAKKYLQGEISQEELDGYISNLDWYRDSANNYDYENEDPFWVEEKNTLAYKTQSYAAMGSEMEPVPAFSYRDNNGDLFVKVFPPNVPNKKDKEFFTLDGRFYDVRLYNHFQDLLSGKKDFSQTSIDDYSDQLIIEEGQKANPSLSPTALSLEDVGDLSEFSSFTMEWNLRLKAEQNEYGETNTYWDWSGVNENQRDVNTYYKVTEADNIEDFRFIPVSRDQVPEELIDLQYSNLENVVNFTPHIESESDLELEQTVMENDLENFGINTDPINYTCWLCDSDGCDETIYETFLDDGSTVRYRWYRFKDQPTFQELKIDYPDVYTTEYLDELQKQIENIQSNWDSNQEFIPTPKSLSKVRLAELDHGLIVEPPEGLEVGWVPIVIEVFHPNGEAQNDIAFLEIELDEDVYGGYVSGR